MKRNIFIKKYEVPEDKLTESFIQFLSCLEALTLKKILKFLGVKTRIYDVTFELQPGGNESRPDAVITDSCNFVVCIEVKKVYSYKSLRFAQLKNHAKFLLDKSAGYKLLLIITPHCIEPIEIKNMWIKIKGRNQLYKRFVSWNGIWSFLQKIKETSGLKDKFLLNQFSDYLNEEGLINMTQAFRKEDATKWRKLAGWLESVETFTRKELGDYIHSSYPSIVFTNFKGRHDDLCLRFRIYKGKAKYIHFDVGFFSGSRRYKEWQDTCFYIGWTLRRKHYNKLSALPSFQIKEKLLRKKDFIAWEEDGPRSFYKLLSLKNIAHKKTLEQQVKYIKKFIDVSIVKFNKVGLLKLL